jgi:hypothetical protein
MTLCSFKFLFVPRACDQHLQQAGWSLPAQVCVKGGNTVVRWHWYHAVMNIWLLLVVFAQTID